MSDSWTLGLASKAVGLVNGAISLLNVTREAAKRSDDHDLKEKLNDLYDAFLDLKEVVGSLRDENDELRKKLDERAKLKWDKRTMLYFMEEDEDPFCPTCLDSSGKQIRLRQELPIGGGPQMGWRCMVCNHYYSKTRQ